MSAFKKGGNFRGSDRSRGMGGGFGGDRGGRPFKKSFGGSRDGFRGSRDFDAPRQMFTATCAACGKTTEVPFRPTGERPVFCRECFDKQASQGKFDRREAPRFERESPRKPEATDRGMKELQAQITGMTHKLDTISSLLAGVAASLQQPKTQSKDLGTVVKKVAKKAAKKKKGE